MPPTGDLFRATVSYRGQGGLNQNVLHFRGDVGGETATDLGFVMIGTYWPAFRNVLNQSVTLLDITCQQLTPIVRDPLVGLSLTPAGNVVGAELNSQLAVIFSLRTGFASRRQRGRIYLGTIPAQYVNVNQLTTLGAETYQTFANEITTNFIGDGALTTFQIGVYSRLVGGDGPTYDVSGFTPAETIQVRTNMGAQRRRRLGRGA